MSFFDDIGNILFGGNAPFRSNNGRRSSNGFSRGVRSLITGNPVRSIYKLISKEQARDMILTNKVLLIDVRTQNEYDSVHIQNAVNLPIDEFEQNIQNIEPDKNKWLMVYCASGVRSKIAIQVLSRLGYGNVYIWEYGALSTFPYRDMLIYSK